MIWLHIFQHKRYASLKANVFITLYATVMLFLMCFLPCMHHWDSMAVGSLFLIWCAPMRNLSISNIIYTSDIPRKPLCSLPCKHQWRTSVFLTLYSKSVLCYLSGMHHWGTSFLDLYSRLRSLCVPYLVSTIEEPLSFLPWMHHWGSKVVLCSYLICTNEEPVFLTWYAPMRNMCSLPCVHQWYSKAVLRCCWLHNARKIWIRILEMDWVHGIMRRRKSIHHFSHTRYLCSCSFEMRSFSKRHTFPHSLTLWLNDWLTHSRYPQNVMSTGSNIVCYASIGPWNL